jgi:diketogulonate reductase-like aldo/keto reductase
LNIDWNIVETELLSFKGSKLEDLSDLTIDTLHGSMWGLNHRYMTLKQALIKDKDSILSYSLKRIQGLLQESNFTFGRKKPLRCGIGFGTYGWKYDHKVIRTAIHYGACLIDTAEGYGYGVVESVLGDVLIDSKPIDVITKVRRDHMSPFSIRRAVNRSVKKLNVTPYIQLHYPNDKFPDAIKDLAALRQKGIVKGIGLGNCSVDMIEAAQRILSDFSGDVIGSVQMPFNLLNTRIKKVLLPYCQERGITIIAYSPLGQNFKQLSSPYLIKVAKKYDCSPAQVALAWILSHDGVIPIPNTNNINHLKENLLSVDLELNRHDVMQLENYYTNHQKEKS